MKFDVQNDDFERDLKWYVIKLISTKGFNYCPGYFTGMYRVHEEGYYGSSHDYNDQYIKVFKTEKGAKNHAINQLWLNEYEYEIIPLYTTSIKKVQRGRRNIWIWQFSLKSSEQWS